MRKRRMSECDLDLEDENSDLDASFEKNDRESDEDTEDASETDMVKQEEEYTEIKEQMYQDKLSNLKKQLQQLEEGTHPEYMKRHKKLEQNYQDRLLLNEVFQKCEIERVEREYELEQEAAVKEFEEKKIELKENLIADLEEKKRLIEVERCTMELTGDSTEVKPVTTRKLRRRPNDPLPMPEKRRKTSPIQLNYILDENDILEDLKIMCKGKYQAPSKNRHESTDGISSGDHGGSSYEVRVEDGKLCYEKKWFHRGQPIYYEGKEGDLKNSAVIISIGQGEVLLKRMDDGGKVRISILQLQKGRFVITRRST